jgi:hypothetical protein
MLALVVKHVQNEERDQLVFKAMGIGRTNKALNRLVSAGEAVVGNQILPDARATGSL